MALLPTPIAYTTAPASSVGLGGQTTQPVAANQQKSFPDWGAYAEKYPEVVAEYNRTKPSMSLGTFAIQHYNTTGKAKGYDVPYLSQQAGYEKYFGAKSPSAYSETTTSYLKQLDDYIAGLGTPEYGGYRRDDPLLATYKSSPNYMGLITPSVQRSEADMLPYIGKPVAENTLYYFNTRTNQGDLSAPADVWVRSNTPLVLYDANKKEIVYAGTGFEAGQQIAKLSDEMSKTQGKDANWVIYQGQAGSTDLKDFIPAAYDTKDKGILGQIADFALPVIGAIAFPGLGIAGGTLGAAAGSAAGSALSGALQGRELEDILKNAAIAGAATYAGGELLQGLGGSTPTAPSGSITPSPAFTEAFSPDFMASLGGATAGTGAGLLPAIADSGITVVGSQLAPSITAGSITGALTGSQLGNILSDVAQVTQPDVPLPEEAPAIEVVAPQTPVTPPVTPPVVVPPLVPQPSPTIPEGTGPETVVEATPEPTPPPPVTPPVVVPPLVPQPSPTIPEGTGPETVVEATPEPTPPPIVPDIFAQNPPQTMTNEQIMEELDKLQKGEPSVFDRIRQGLGIYSLLDNLAGNLLGGGGGAGTTPYTSMLGTAPNLGRGQFQPFTGDYETYAFGPEWQFFRQPTTSTPPSTGVTFNYTPLI